jgi:hypothetical protein
VAYEDIDEDGIRPFSGAPAGSRRVAIFHSGAGTVLADEAMAALRAAADEASRRLR